MPSHPVSIAWADDDEIAGRPAETECRRSVIARLTLAADVCLALGVGRFDCTKDILERPDAVEHLLEEWPASIRRFVFVQIAAPMHTAMQRMRDRLAHSRAASNIAGASFQNEGPSMALHCRPAPERGRALQDMPATLTPARRRVARHRRHRQFETPATARTRAMNRSSGEFAYPFLVVGSMVVARLLRRWRVPARQTSFGLGMVAALFFAGVGTDPTLSPLATLGISSLFLFAGLEIGWPRSAGPSDRWPVSRHAHSSAGRPDDRGRRSFGFAWQPVALLALLTPSTGFVIETLPAFGLDAQERYWVRVKASGGKILALLVLFIVPQTTTWPRLAGSTAALALLLVGLSPVL